ncbi:MAG: hypothetical protein WAO23_05080 [Dethiobacteria bacterium]
MERWKRWSPVFIIAILLVLVVILAYFNRMTMSKNEQDMQNPVLVVKIKGEEAGRIDLEQMKTLGVMEFTTTLRTSTASPSDHTYMGIPLENILSYVVDDFRERGVRVVARAVDAYVVAYDMDELSYKDHLYLVFARDGERLAGKSSGGFGPLLLIAKQDQFGQRWCKYVTEVDVQ